MKHFLIFTFTFFLFSNLVIASTNEVAISNVVEKVKQITNEVPVKIVAPKPKRVPTKQLVKLLGSASNSVDIIKIIETIGNQDCGSKYVLEAFSGFLTNKDEDVRQAVLDAACTFDSQKKLLPNLINALNDPVESIREDSADIISDIETRDMIGAFVCNLTNKYEDVRENCEFYLLFHTDEDFPTVAEWVNWWASNKTSFVFE